MNVVILFWNYVTVLFSNRFNFVKAFIVNLNDLLITTYIPFEKKKVRFFVVLLLLLEEFLIENLTLLGISGNSISYSFPNHKTLKICGGNIYWFL